VTTANRTKLFVESPDVRDREAHFAVEFPGELTEEMYGLLRQQLEFRRRCMNQGFDNLLELLDLHWQSYQRCRAKGQPGPDNGPPPDPDPRAEPRSTR
jgi:hypothetical protein